ITRHRSPVSAHICCFDIIKIGPSIYVPLRMPVKERTDFPVLPGSARLVMSGFFTGVLRNSCQQLILRPVDSIGTSFKVQLANPCIPGKQMQITSFRLPGLGVGHFFFRCPVKMADRIWRAAFVFESRSRPSTAADEHPDKALPVDHDRGIVMGIYDSLLIANDGRSGYLTALMIIDPDHTEQVPRGISGCSAIYKKSLINGWCINRQRDVLGCVGSQCPGIFIAIIKTLPKFKPDPPVTIHSGIV